MRPLTSRLWVRLAAICVAAAVLPILIGGLLIAHQFEQNATRQAATRLDRTAEIAAAMTERFARRGASKLLTLARLLAERTDAAAMSDDSDLRHTVLAQLESQVEPPGVFLGLQYQSSEPGGAMLNANSSEVAIAQQGALQLPTPPNRESQLAFSQITQPPVPPPIAPRIETNFGFVTVPLTAPVTTAGRSRGLLLGYLDLRELAAELQPLADDDLGITVLDEEAAKMVAVGSEPAAADAETVTTLVADLGWRVTITGARSTAMAAARAARHQAWTTTFTAGILAAMLAMLVATWLVRPIVRLTRSASAMAKGDLTARANLQRQDEIGELGAAFDGMAAAVQRLDEAKSAFVGTVSHELRTPLTSLRANIQNLADGIHGELAGAQQTAVLRLASDVARLEDIVNETLQLSRLEAGAEVCHPTPCELRDIAKASSDAQAAAAAERGIDLEVTGNGRALADPTLLRRALANLLDNALQFAPQGSRITIELSPGMLRVRDRGPGFALDRPFEPFAQGSTEGRKNPGVGLGLAIVARITKLLGGEATAHNDGGAVVTIQLPEAP